MKLRNQLSLAVTVVTAIVLLASSGVIVVLVKRDETRDLDNTLAAQAATMAELVRVRGDMHPEIYAQPAELPENLEPSTRFVAVYERAQLVAQSQSFRGQAPLSEPVGKGEVRALDLGVASGALRAVIIPLGAGRTLLYAASRRSVDDDIAYLMRVLAALFAAAMLATSLIARWLSGLLIADVNAIAGVARKVTHGDLEARAGKFRQRSADTRALARDLDQMIERLSALMAAQRLFISHAAHELRSPLATIRGELQLALRKPRSTEEYREAIDAVLADVQGLADLAEDLLTLARVESTKPGAHSAQLGDVVSAALRMARGSAEAGRVELVDATGAAAAWCVPGPAHEMGRVLRNLVDNAVAHSSAGSEVTIAAERSGERVRVTVSDQGPGVDAADAPHIFSPFFRSSSDRVEHGGAGLGLSIAREIARRCGGDVWLDEQHVGGARFIVEPPLRPAPAPQ